MTEELRSMAVILSIINSRSTAIGSGEWMDSLTKPDDRTTARHFGKLQPPPSVHQSSGKWYESSPPPPFFPPHPQDWPTNRWRRCHRPLFDLPTYRMAYPEEKKNPWYLGNWPTVGSIQHSNFQGRPLDLQPWPRGRPACWTLFASGSCE